MTDHYAKRILDAQSEAEVTRILDNIMIDENVSWVPTGSEQNYSVTFSNAADPISSFAELIVNSFDAILMKRYKEQFENEYDPATGLITVEQAVDELFDDANDSSSHDELVDVIADGDPNTVPNLTVQDTGMGQPHEAFEDRFLNFALGGQVKDDWPFTQGRFKMGSAAVLPHSGDCGYKLICSASVDTPEQWSWSITRDNPEEGVFEHLLIDGDIPTFTGTVREQSYGTFTKVYEYDIPKTHITGSDSLRPRIERVLVNPAFPFHMHEQRDKGAQQNQQHVHGLYGRLDGRWGSNTTKIDTHIRHDFGEPFGERKIRVCVFHDEDTIQDNSQMSMNARHQFVGGRKHREGAVMYLVNGQAHAHERSSFLTGSRRCQYTHTGKDMVVFMDLSDFGDKQRHNRRDFLDLFRPSRDRMGGTDLSEQLQDELEKALKNSETLQEEEEWRRNRLMKDDHEEKQTDIMESVLERNPSLNRFFNTGQRVTTSSVPETSAADGGEYNASFYPIKLNIIKKKHNDGSVDLWNPSKGLFTKHQPVNRNGRVQFELDAQNDYFDRNSQPGVLMVDGAERKNWNLHNGILSLKIKPLSGAEPGEKQQVTVTVTREMADPLRRVFTVKYVDPVEESSESSGTNNSPSADDLDLPEVIPVHESGDDKTTWDDMNPTWTEDDIVSISERDETYDIFVNMDASPLHHFVQTNNIKDSRKGQVQEIWVAGCMFYTVSQYIELENDGDVVPEDIVPITMRGVAQSMLDQHISDEELERLTA